MQAIHALPCGAELHVTDVFRQSRRLGIIGSAVGLLALLVSALTYLLPDTLLYRPLTPVTETAAKKDSETVIFRIKRLEIKSREASERHPTGTTWEQALSTAAVSLGLLAIAFAVSAVIFREEKLLAGIAATLGAVAIAVQVWWVLVIVAVAMIIANAFCPFCTETIRPDAVRAWRSMSRIDAVIGTGRWVL